MLNFLFYIYMPFTFHSCFSQDLHNLFFITIIGALITLRIDEAL